MIDFAYAKTIQNPSFDRFGPMDHQSIMYAPTQLALKMEDVIGKIMMWLATMMVVIAVPMEKRLEMEYVTKKT